MTELTLAEMQEVSGGLLPLIGALIAIDICIWTAVALK
jgi:lactobin A/cerein 7B family class IIb bacteriocin